MRKRTRKLRRTVHVVGEGHDEHAFIKYLKSIYVSRELQVSTSNAKGKGPGHIIKFAISKKRQIGYDYTVALLDTDIEWTAADQKAADTNGVILLGSRPLCLEGMLLELLGERPPRTSKECKIKLHALLRYKASEPRSYADLFPVEFLNGKRAVCPTLDSLIKILEEGKL